VSGRQRAALIVAAVVVVVAAFVIIGSGDDDNSATVSTQSSTQTAGGSGGTPATTTTPARPEVTRIVVKDGKPVGGITKISVKHNDQVRFTVTSDVADEVHLHGYDIAKDVDAGGSVTFSFKAKLEGVFEAELEDRKEQILSLEVSP
jgi:hypothetical protein